MSHFARKRPDFSVFGHLYTFSHLHCQSALTEEEIVLWKHIRKAFYAKGKDIYSKFLGREECAAPSGKITMEYPLETRSLTCSALPKWPFDAG